MAELGNARSSGIQAGDLLAERYLVEAFVARGGMGEVYRARDTELGVSVALKTIRADLVSDPQALRRFKQEILLARSVSHPGVCRMFDLGRHRDGKQDMSFLTMEFLPGETLASRIRSRGRISLEDGLPIVRQLAEALDNAHRAGIVHRDFKSSNVMIVRSASDERVVVTDFGLAQAVRLPAIAEDPSMERASGREAPGSPGVRGRSQDPGATACTVPLMDSGPEGAGTSPSETDFPSIVGTPAYMAPEQIRGGPVSPAADLYSFGVVLFEMATGVVPFQGLTPVETFQAKLTHDPPRPSSFAEVDPAWEEAIVRLLAREPEQRFSSAGDVVDALEGRRGASTFARHSLPAERDPFVGRNRALAELARRLEGGGAVLTLLGAGGTGKTRLARRYGWLSLDRWPGGVWFCDLTEAGSPDGIAAAVAGGLGVPLGRIDPITQIGHAVAGRGRALIILDNFEQVSDHAEATLSRWVARAPEASFLVTSRERLHLEGETAFELDPLDPDTEGVDLFARRAQAQRPDFELTELNRSTVAEIVTLVDGLPLAIELAASRLRALSLEQLRARLANRLGLLAGPERGRHATLRATMEWSWALLKPWERAGVAQASVFEGGFTLEAAEAVLDLTPWPGAPAVLDVVQALVDRCWIRARALLGAPRFEMLSSLREFAAEKLKTEGVVPGTDGPDAALRFEGRHGEFYARFGDPEFVDALDRHGGVAAQKMLGPEVGNLVAACRRGVARQEGELAVRALAAAWAVLALRGPFETAEDLAEAVLSIPSLEADARTRALRHLAEAMRNVGRMDDARRVYEQVFAALCESGDRRAQAGALGSLATVRMNLGHVEEARRLYEAALALHREFRNRRGEGTVLGNLAILHKSQGRMDDAQRLYEDVLAIQRELGNRRFEGIALGNLGILHAVRGRAEDAHRLFEEALAIYRELGDRYGESVVLDSLAGLYRSQGRLEEACRLCKEALVINREVGDRRFEAVALGNLASLHRDQGRTADARRVYGEARAIFQELGDRHNEGVLLRSLGELETVEMRLPEARLAFAQGEAVVREVGDRLELARLLCSRGECERLAGDVVTARNALVEAGSLAGEIGVGPDSGLGRQLAGLRDRLAGTREGSSIDPSPSV